jgi:SAM-dependent methyltransferase
MREEDGWRFDPALDRARVAAYAPGEFVGQEGFMTAAEIVALAEQAGVGPGVSVLDVCCGAGGPGRFVTRRLGCDYLGVDDSPRAVTLGRERANGSPCRFAVAQVPPLPAGDFGVVLLLEAFLAFEDKDALVREVAAALRPGGRFAFTLEAGPPLTAAERAAMPAAGTVWPIPLDELTACLARAGLVVTWHEDRSAAHASMARALACAFAANHADVAGRIGRPTLDYLAATHGLWASWLEEGRMRKLAVVAAKSGGAT